MSGGNSCLEISSRESRYGPRRSRMPCVRCLQDSCYDTGSGWCKCGSQELRHAAQAGKVMLHQVFAQGLNSALLHGHWLFFRLTVGNLAAGGPGTWETSGPRPRSCRRAVAGSS